MSHTKGPWVIGSPGYGTDNSTRDIGSPGRDANVATVWGCHGQSVAEAAANAALISAAPDMYEDLREIIFFLENFDPSNREYETVKKVRLQFAKTTLSKARGEK